MGQDGRSSCRSQVPLSMNPWRRRRSPQKSVKSSETAGTADEASFHEIGNIHVHVHDHDQANHGPPTSGATPRARAENADTMINLQELRYNAEEGEIAPGLSDAGDVPAAGSDEQVSIEVSPGRGGGRRRGWRVCWPETLPCSNSAPTTIIFHARHDIRMMK